MIVTVRAKTLSGVCQAPPSKSDSHRALIGAALADGFSTVGPLSFSQDIQATLSAVGALDAHVQLADGVALVQGVSGKPAGHVRIYCNESGSTLRFMIPVAAAFGMEAVFTGSGKLPQRPLNLYHQMLTQKGVTMTRMEEDELPLKIFGQLRPGRYELAGNVSSQFVTGLLFALPLLEGDSELLLTSPLESKPYVDMTLSTLSRYGVRVEEIRDGYRIPGRQRYKPCAYTVEGDYSNAAFFLAAGLASETGVRVRGLSRSSRQGDQAILELIRRFGGNLREENGDLLVSQGALHGIDIDAAQIPDLVPILSVIGAMAPGRTYIYNAHRLKLKESDRLLSTTQCLARLGADIMCDDGSITIQGGKRLHGGIISACNDHRIAMSAAIAALFCDGEVVIDGAECVQKSYPNFYEVYQKLGGDVDVNLGE